MTTQPQPEALPQASDDITQRLLSELAGIDTYDVSLRDNPEAWEAVDRFVLAYATEHAARLHAECEALRADRDSWERQCSDRVDDAVDFLQQRDEARAELRRLHAECEALLSCVEQWRDLYRRAFGEACWATDSSNLFVIASEARALDAARAAKEQA